MDRARAVNYLGIFAYNRGRLEDRGAAVSESSKACAPAGGGRSSQHQNLGAVRQRRGFIDQALQSYREALSRRKA